MSACRRDAGARREGYARERRPRLRNEDRAGCLPAFKTAAPRGRATDLLHGRADGREQRERRDGDRRRDPLCMRVCIHRV